MNRVRQVAGYAVASAVVVSVMTAGLWPWVGDEARDGLASAAVLALGFQVAAFALLVRIRHGAKGFLLGLAGGMLGRMGLVAVVAVLSTAGGDPGPGTAARVLGLIGYLLALVLLEAWFVRDGQTTTQRSESTS